MPDQPERGTVCRFGLYEVHAASGDVFRQGRRIRLQEQPFKLLVALLERPNEIVSRETLRQRLWPGDTFVEFDQSLATAVTKLRQALGDTADNPRFIETVPKRGYRFLAPVTVVDPPRLVTPARVQTIADGVAPQESSPPPTPPQGSRRGVALRYVLGPALLVAVLGGVAGVYFYHRRGRYPLTPRDTVLIADFVNTTGEPVFDDALRQGVEIGLQQSPVMNVLSDRKTAVILKEMGRSPDDRVTGKVAIEACQRAGSKVAVQGSIAGLGSAYLIGLAAIRCDNGAPIALDQVQASRKEEVVDALGSLTRQLRIRLGEALPSIRKYDVPLEQATTGSLEALRAYSLGLTTWDQKGDDASIPFFEQAVQIDPNFAMAYGALATIYHNLSEDELARRNAARAYALRDRVTDYEKLSIESWYFLYATGDLEKAAQIYEVGVQDYPNSAGAFNHLGTTYAELGRFREAAEELRQALRLDPTRATTYGNLAADLLALNRVDEAGSVLGEAARLRMETDFLLQVNYWKAFLGSDRPAMEHIVQRSENVAGARSLLLFEQANTEAYYGHFQNARQLSLSAVEVMIGDGDKEAAGECMAVAAIREAEAGNAGYARADAARAMQLTRDQNVLAMAALSSAIVGDLNQADRLSKDLDKEHPSATIVQKYWLPTISAALDLRRGRTEDAVRKLNDATPFESASSGELFVGTLYPAYLRGEAYLAMKDGNRADAEFQKLIDHPGLVLNSPLGVLARLGKARADSGLPDPSRTRSAYQDFFSLWKDADPDTPILRQARMEFSKLPH